jgi:CDGSH-type Zn-finger protein/uncharacterized Fe-S cluster protein YjdI
MSASHSVPKSREQLWGLLAEAAEIEHHLMCCYLYAFFSLKESVDEDITEAELQAIRRWRTEILDVAIEEMAHLSMVCNILSALGAPAHFAHQNFPVSPGFHPAGVVVKLTPFNPDTLDHFIYLERPGSIDIGDGKGFEPPQQYTRSSDPERLMSITTDYDAVGQLYAAINEGLAAMTAEIGEDKLFVGDAAHQIGPEVAPLPNLKVVRCLKTARIAIDAIIRQGEGAEASEARSHYQRFLAIKQEYDAARAARPAFHPARMAAHNPVMRRPPTPEGKLWITAEPAASLLDLGNALYNHCLRCLSLAYTGVNPATQRVLVQASIDLMRLLTPVASRLTALPANAEQPECTAGLSFATLRSSAALPAEPGGLTVLAERLRDIGQHASQLADEHDELAELLDGVIRGVGTLGDRLSRAASQREPAPVAIAAIVAAPAPARTARTAAAPSKGIPTPQPLGDGFELIPGAAIDLIYSGKRCIHSRHCVLGLPDVFKANVEGPWIDPNAASTEDLVTVAHMCPSGAIQYRRHDGGADEAAPPVNLLQLRENGPLGFRAEILLDGKPIGMRAVLCRCGASKNKPFCDGSHNEIGFQATGEPDTKPTEPLAARGAPLAIDPEINGPLVVSGNLELCCGTGRTFDRVTTVRLCRCGGSANKPYCDNTHRTNGFRS